MSSALYGLLAGINQGVSTGLDLYKTVQGEARANRLEQYQRERDARRDMEADRSYQFDRDKFSTANDQWERNFEFGQTQHADLVKHRERLADIQSRQVDVSAGNLQLGRDRFNADQAEAARLRRTQSATALLGSALLDEDGRYITDNAAFAERANSNPQVLKAMLDLAAENGMIDAKRVSGYTGAQLVATPKGLVMRVAGTDATGKPIKPGGGVLSENGTDDPNDPYVAINVGQLRHLVDPNYREAQKSAALARDRVESYNAVTGEEEQAATTSLSAALAKQQQLVADSEARLAQLQAERDKLPATVSSPVLAGGIGGGPGVPRSNPEVDRLDEQIAALQGQTQQGRATLANLTQQAASVPEVYAQRRSNYAAQVGGDYRLHGERYAANSLAAALEAPKKQVELQKKAGEGFDKVVENAIKDNVPKTRKGEPAPKVPAAELRKVLYAMPAEVQFRAGSDKQYAAAVYDVAQQMAKTGVVADPVFMLEARAAGADLDAYTEYLASPSNAGRDPAQVHAEAVEIGKQKAANPSASTATLSGLLQLQR
jgi:hypothetical protein